MTRSRLALPAAALLSLALAGCGTQMATPRDSGPAPAPTTTAMTVPGTTSTTNDPDTPVSGTGKPGGPVTITPTVKPDQSYDAWRATAQATAKHLRDSGALDTWATTLVPVSPLYQVDTFGTDVVKFAWEIGAIRYEGPATLPLPSPFPIGAADDVAILPTLLQPLAALKATHPNISGCGDAASCLTISGATLTQMTVQTNHGQVTVPAWELTGLQLTSPILVSAVDPAGWGKVPTPSQPPAALVMEADRRLAGNYVDLAPVTDPMTLRLTFGHGACDRDIASRVLELDDMVLVGFGFAEPTAEVCNSMLMLTPADVRLTEAVGFRPVVNAMTGEILVPVGQPWDDPVLESLVTPPPASIDPPQPTPEAS